MDIYVVTDGQQVVGASARLQGAELIRTEEAQRWAETQYTEGARRMGREAADPAAWKRDYFNLAYDRMAVTNIELRDLDD